MPSRYLLINLDVPQTRPLYRFHSIFATRNGIYSPLDRIHERDPKAEIHFLHPDQTHEASIAELHGGIPYSKENTMNLELSTWLGNPGQIRSDIEKLKEAFTQIFFSTEFAAPENLDSLGRYIENDVKLWLKKRNKTSIPKCVDVIGKEKHAYIHREANVAPGCVIDTRQGPVIIDAHAEIRPFSYLRGPLYIAPEAHIDNAQIKGPAVIGRGARIGGEVEASIIGDFSNKHHEGFVGHSIIGNWVNLGALTTTSDLKNNYSNVRLELPRKAGNYQEKIIFNTQKTKFGAIIGDFVKTAIGTLMNTGTVIDAGCNVFGGNVNGYLPPFTWGNATSHPPYELERFLSDMQKIAKRREQTFCETHEKLVRKLHASVSYS